MKKTADLTLLDLTALCAERLKNMYTQYLRDIPTLALSDPMAYTLSNAGKQLRPLLVYATASIFDTPWENCDIAASAVELVHTYSLIHDDLPSMDNADLRRGKAACHKVYGEGMAVLTGDALLTLAMEILSSHPSPLKAERRLQMLKVLSSASGPYGMVAGQAMDITVDGNVVTNDLLLDIYRLKTGALFTASIELGRLSSDDDDEFNQRALREFGNCLGLAFQIQDDILDIEATTETLGKTQGTDTKNEKLTYPRLHGVENAKQKVESLFEEALTAIDYLSSRARLLRQAAKSMMGRKS